MLTYFEKDDLDKCVFAMDVIIFGQEELFCDYIDIANYMLKRGFSKEVVNSCFTTYSGVQIDVCTN